MLNYKASNIAKAENETGKNFFDVITSLSATPSMSNLAFLYKAGGASDDEFDEAFSKGVTNIILEIMKAINEAGFLGKEVDLAELEKELTSGLSGEKI